MIDIVIPNNNESKFISTAVKLGYTGLVFLYDQKNRNNVNVALKLKKDEKRIKIFTAFVADKKKQMQGVDLFLTTKSDRKFLKGEFDMIYDIELNIQDTMKQRQGGLNQVLCNVMKENDVSYCISFSTALISTNRADLIGSIMQNLLLCQKYKVKIAIASFASSIYQMRNPKDLEAFVRLLGVKDSKKAMSYLDQLMAYKCKKMLLPGIEQI
ncbi:hypothetical protein KY340_01160 [Candidatus Woesearchaeota archaeon]|nr:hypothetical protein [Candidatus Woesearchaeota archaeon]